MCCCDGGAGVLQRGTFVKPGARLYRSGQGWALWRWTEVDWRGVTYLLRLHLLQVPRLGAVMLHWIRTPDPHPDPHTHPVNFISITLRGGYVEWTPAGYCTSRARFRRATDLHKIVAVRPGTLTLVLAGSRRREWDFQTPAGPVGWREYRRRHGA